MKLLCRPGSFLTVQTQPQPIHLPDSHSDFKSNLLDFEILPGSFPGCLNATPRSDSHTRFFPLDFSLPDSLFATRDTICSACSDRSVAKTLLSILFQYQTTAGLLSRQTYTLKLLADSHSSHDGHIHSYSCVCRLMFVQVDSGDMAHVPMGAHSCGDQNTTSTVVPQTLSVLACVCLPYMVGGGDHQSLPPNLAIFYFLLWT